MTKATEEMLALADKIEYAIKTEGEITLFETNGTRVVYVLRSLAAQSAGEPPTARVSLEPRCPFCARDPFHYVDNGVGMEAVAVTCCDLGDLYFRGMRVAPDEITMSWEDFDNIGRRLAALSVPPGDQARDENSALTKIAAECHRAKWQFDLNDDYKPTASAARGLILKAFQELHRIGDIAMNLRAEVKKP